MELLRAQIIAKHDTMINDLEMKYLSYFSDLLKQKAIIHQQIQKSFYTQLNRIPFNNIKTTTNINITNHGDSSSLNESITLVSSFTQSLPIPPNTIQSNEYAIKTHPSSITTNDHDINTSDIPIIDTTNIVSLNSKTNETDIDKTQAGYFKTKGNKLLKQKKYKDAIIEYNKAIYWDPLNVVCLSNRAAAFTKLNKYKKALKDAHKASEIDPNYTKAYIRAGWIHYQMGHYRKALTAYSVALSKLKRNNENDNKIYKDIQHKITLCKTQQKLKENELEFECRECDELFTKKQSLSKHMLVHRGLKQFICNECKKPFKMKQDLRKHTDDVHSINDKPFKCSICAKRFRRKGGMTKHMLTHSNQRKYKCSACGYRYKRAFNLKHHMKVHSGICPYKCDECNGSFNSSTALIYHKKYHQNIEEKTHWKASI